MSLLLKRKDIVDTVAGPGADLSVTPEPAAAAAAPAASESKKARGGKK